MRSIVCYCGIPIVLTDQGVVADCATTHGHTYVRLSPDTYAYAFWRVSDGMEVVSGEWEDNVCVCVALSWRWCLYSGELVSGYSVMRQAAYGRG